MPTLDYASNQTARPPWGPILFKPSARSLILILLTAATITWIAKRHDPWQYVGPIKLPPAVITRPSVHFTPEGQLLTCGQTAATYNPDTGQRIRTIGQSIGAPYTFEIKSAREVVQISAFNDGIVYDTRTGDKIKS